MNPEHTNSWSLDRLFLPFWQQKKNSKIFINNKVLSNPFMSIWITHVSIFVTYCHTPKRLHEWFWVFPQNWFPRCRWFLTIFQWPWPTSSYKFPFSVGFQCQNTVHYPWRFSSLYTQQGEKRKMLKQNDNCS